MSTQSNVWPTSDAAAGSGQIVRAGLLGGLVGGLVIWIYEAIVWVGVQHLMPMAGIPRQCDGPGPRQGGPGFTGSAGLHCRHRNPLLLCARLGRAVRFRLAVFPPPRLEATLVALFFAVILWIVMHVAIAIVSNNHPDYLDPS